MKIVIVKLYVYTGEGIVFFGGGGARGRSYGEFEIALLILFRVRKGIVKVALLN